MKFDLQSDSGGIKDIRLDVTHSGSLSPLMRFSCDAMGTTFELRLCCEDVAYGKQVARASFELVADLERELSRFKPASDVWRINALKPGENVRVGIATFECLDIALRMHRETYGAFDVTVMPLYRLWKHSQGSEPSDAEIAEALNKTGMESLILDRQNHSVGVIKEGIQVDLGGIGKGYAIDQVVSVLKDWGIQSALIHGGHSSVYALGNGVGESPWRLSFREGREGETDLPDVFLQDFSLSGSGTFIQGQHVIDPRTGRAIAPHETSWALAAKGVDSDVLSTAFLVMRDDEFHEYCSNRQGVFGVKCSQGETPRFFGDWETLKPMNNPIL